jgi:site-specific DNA-methyltransferase (adenine-specific)
MTPELPKKKYDIIYADPPWLYYGDPNKDQAAGKHYSCMTEHELCGLSVQSICREPTVLFLWSTSPMLQEAIGVMNAWGFYYFGVAYVWVKTAKDGHIINGQGVRPSFTKSTTEYVLAGSTQKKGRTFPILNEGQAQVVLAQRGEHSEKPAVVRDRIIELLGDRPRIELFARQHVAGWDAWGLEADGKGGSK